MEKTIDISEAVRAEKRGDFLMVTGPLGSVEKELRSPKITWSIEGQKIIIKSRGERRKDLALVGTFAAHARNMLLGVEKGFQADLKVIYSHFPMKVKIEGRDFIVQNFMGERSSRQITLPAGVKVDVKKDDIVISGPNKESVGQAAGRIERLTKVKGFDRRVFQDGIHLVSKTRRR